MSLAPVPNHSSRLYRLQGNQGFKPRIPGNSYEGFAQAVREASEGLGPRVSPQYSRSKHG